MTAPGGWELVTEIDDQNPVIGDLRIAGTRIAKLQTFGDAVRQAVQVSYRWWRGEWFLDRRRGVPYIEEILRKGVTEASVRAVMKRATEQVQGVARVLELEVAIDRSTRRGTSHGQVQTAEGETVDIPATPIGGL